MKPIAKIILLGVVLFASPMSVADTGLSKGIPITVTISPEVQKQIQEASPDERKKMVAAISVGNKYIPYHFNGSAYCADSQKFWQKNIHPLVNRDITKWYSDYEITSASTSVFTIDGRSYTDVAVCPQIELISVATANEHYDLGWKTWYPMSFINDSFILKYRTKIIGAWDGFVNPLPKDFLPVNNEEFETVLISLDENNKIDQVATQHAVTEFTTERDINILMLYISGVWSLGVSAADKARLKQMIQKIKVEETRVCVGTAATKTQPSTKE